MLPIVAPLAGCCCWSKKCPPPAVVLHTEHDCALAPGECQVERGRPVPVIDTVGWVVGIPSKLLMLNHRINNHNISPETEVQIQGYLAINGLDKVKVRLNQYDPLGEWRRLVGNKSVSWPLRYTFGTLTVAEYTLLPGRVFGGDYYNPYTNSVYVYSDVPAIAVFEACYSKDYAQREYKGLYAVAYDVPGVGIFFQDAHASREAIDFFQETRGSDEVKASYRTVCPAYAITASRPFGAVGRVPLVLPAAVAGHLVGQTRAYRVEDAPVEAGGGAQAEHLSHAPGQGLPESEAPTAAEKSIAGL